MAPNKRDPQPSSSARENTPPKTAADSLEEWVQLRKELGTGSNKFHIYGPQMETVYSEFRQLLSRAGTITVVNVLRLYCREGLLRRHTKTVEAISNRLSARYVLFRVVKHQLFVDLLKEERRNGAYLVRLFGYGYLLDEGHLGAAVADNGRWEKQLMEDGEDATAG
ncbi:MAG: hypothetical protein Q9218_005570 [Villophora microphyllina]